MPDSAQDRGRAWERELARLVGGRLQKGSGNRCYAKLDVAGRQIIWSAKHTDDLSFRLSRADFDEARQAVMGPSGIDPTIMPILGIHMGDNTMLASLDLMELIAWIREPPEIIAPTKRDQLRATAKVPPMMR